MALEIDLVPCLSDNYAYLLHDPEAGVTGIVDPSEARPVISALEKRGLQLTHILNTHHHHDHVGGNTELKKKYGAKVVGPKADEERIPGIDVALAEGDEWSFGNQKMQTFHTPGHTKGHASYYFPSAKAVFTGDTLFSLGCGRLFEGTASQMHESLSKLASLPEDTRVYCGHEYTQSNAKFAKSVEPSNKALQQKYEQIDSLRKQGKPTIPSTIGEEKEVNPFLRWNSEEIREKVGVGANAAEHQVLAQVRRAKDSF